MGGAPEVRRISDLSGACHPAEQTSTTLRFVMPVYIRPILFTFREAMKFLGAALSSVSRPALEEFANPVILGSPDPLTPKRSFIWGRSMMVLPSKVTKETVEPAAPVSVLVVPASSK